MIFKGALTALTTPFHKNEEIDFNTLQLLIERQIDAGIDGIVLLGTTGESPTIDHDERTQLIQEAIRFTKGKIPLIVGCGTYSTKETIEQVIMAQDLGCDAVMVVAPYYNRPTPKGFYEHFKKVASSIDIPLCIYNIPSRTGQNMDVETITKLSDIKNIVAIKEASGNINHTQDVVEKLRIKRPDFSVLAGDDAFTLPLMALGAKGIISVMSNLLPKTVKELTNAIVKSDLEKAQLIHYALKPLVQAAFIETNPGPIKYMLEYAKLANSTVRLPLAQVMESNACKINEILQKCEQLLLAEELAPCAQ